MIRFLIFKLTACVFWKISEIFEWLWGFFEQLGDFFEDWLWTEDGPDLSGFRYLFENEYSYRHYEDPQPIKTLNQHFFNNQKRD